MILITADHYASTDQAIADAIRESVSQDETVIIEVLNMPAEGIESTLIDASEGSVVITEGDNRLGRVHRIVECWGEDADGEDWRVHLHIRS